MCHVHPTRRRRARPLSSVRECACREKRTAMEVDRGQESVDAEQLESEFEREDRELVRLLEASIEIEKWKKLKRDYQARRQRDPAR